MRISRTDTRLRLAPMAMVGVLGAAWPLPLGWPAWIATLAALMALAIVALRAVKRDSGKTARVERTALAAGCLASVGLIGLGYAAAALIEPGAFAPVRRLGYPFLVATGLRLPGGLCVLLLCALVSLIPVLFREDEMRAAR
jgi:hypothetical protein